jgi:hypothetical protein
MARQYPNDERGRARVGQPGRRVSPRTPLSLLAALLLPACATTGALPPLEPAPRPAGARFDLQRDVFAFANLVRAEHPDRPVDFANYCIAMARGASQFYRFARFAPADPPVSAAEYARRIGEVLGTSAWEPPWPPERRVVIPAYPDLHAFSRAEEPTIKAAFGSQTGSMLHWRNWRAMFPLGPDHQERVARELRLEIDGDRPVPIMISNAPDPDELKHVVLVYDYRWMAGVLEFLAYDPNDPDNPLSLAFDRATRSFWTETLTYGPPGRIRAFRIFTSRLL